MTVPAEVDISNAAQLREDLLSAVAQGASLVIADMSATTFCGSAGVTALVRVVRQAAASCSGGCLLQPGVRELEHVRAGQRGERAHGDAATRGPPGKHPAVAGLPPCAERQPSSSSNGCGCGGSPLTLVTIAVAMSRSLRLLLWDAGRRISNALARGHRSRAMITPRAW